MLSILKSFLSLLEKQAKQYSFLIKEIEVDDGGSYVAIIQVGGKPVFFPRKVKDLVKDEPMLYQFPPEQIKTLVTLACHEQAVTPAYTISAIDFDSDGFVVKETLTGKLISLSLDEVNEPYLLDGFSKKELFKIGVMYGEYIARTDYDDIRAMRQPKLNVVQNYFK